MLIGGKGRKIQFGPDDYVFAALNIFLDIIKCVPPRSPPPALPPPFHTTRPPARSLFLYLLALFGRK